MVFECPENTDALDTMKGLYPGHNITEYCEKCLHVYKNRSSNINLSYSRNETRNEYGNLVKRLIEKYNIYKNNKIPLPGSHDLRQIYHRELRSLLD